MPVSSKVWSGNEIHYGLHSQNLVWPHSVIEETGNAVSSWVVSYIALAWVLLSVSVTWFKGNYPGCCDTCLALGVNVGDQCGNLHQ